MSDPGPTNPKTEGFNQNIPLPVDDNLEPGKPESDGFPKHSPGEPVNPRPESPE